MYLYVRRDTSARQVRDNISVADLILVKVGQLHVYRFHPDKHAFQRLVLDEGRPCWVPVPEADVGHSNGAKLHL